MSKEAADQLLGIMESTGELLDDTASRTDLVIVAERKIEALASMKQSIKKESIEVSKHCRCSCTRLMHRLLL